MQWTVRLEARTSAGAVKITERVTISRPAVVSTLAEIGLMLDETKTPLARLQASLLCGQVAEGPSQDWGCDGQLVIFALLLQVRCAVYNGTLGSSFGQKFQPANDPYPPMAIAA
jgi:hypothetical protein